MALSSSHGRSHRALALLERGVDAASFLTPLLEPEDLYAQLAEPAVKKPQNERLRAGQVPAGLPAKLAWGKRGRAKLARIYHRPINSTFSKLSQSCSEEQCLDTSINGESVLRPAHR